MRKWKKILGWWFLLACFVAVFNQGGCGYQFKYHRPYSDLKIPIYAATIGDVGFIGTAFLGEGSGDVIGPGALIPYLPFALVDIPLAVAIDTVTLPYDGYITYRNQRTVSFWKKAFQTGVIPPNKPMDSYFNKGEWLDLIIIKGMHGNPPPTKEVLDYIIDLSLKHNPPFDHGYNSPIRNLAECKSLAAEQIERIYFWDADGFKNDSHGRVSLLVPLLKLPAVTDELLEKIGQSTNEGALLPLLKSERVALTTKTNLISRLIDSPNWVTRRTVASNPNTSLEQLMRLASDPHGEVRIHVAANRNAPPEVLDKLARQKSKLLGGWLCQNPNTSAETLRFMFNNESRKIHYDLLRNPNVPADVIDAMATYHIKNPASDSRGVLEGVACHANVQLSVLEKLANLSNGPKEAIARNPKGTADILWVLAKDGNHTVRSLVIKHPNVTPEIKAYIEQQRGKKE